jgi:type III secretion system HrpB2-like protein
MLEATMPIGAVMELAHKSVNSGATEQLSLKFEAMMKAPNANAAQAAHLEQKPNALTEVVNKQEVLISGTSKNIEYMALHSHEMTPTQMVMATMQVSHEAAVSNVHMQASMAIGSSTKKGIDSLLKNQ